MKKYKIVLLGLLVSISCLQWISAQEYTGESFRLNQNMSGNKTYIARDTVHLMNNFTYKSVGGSTFRASLDPTLIFPPNNQSYISDGGNFTDEPSSGASVGVLPGFFDVSQTGAAVYSVPIKCPEGINGMQPNISLEFNSQAGNGLVGMCWNISGLSMISRDAKNLYFEDERSYVIWNNTSPLTLDGQRLIVLQSTADSIVYCTESGLERIVGYDVTPWGPNYFRIYGKDGKLFEYNRRHTTDSDYAVKKEGEFVYTLGWALNKVTDKEGNYMVYEYEKTEWKAGYYGDHRISAITYYNNRNTVIGTIVFRYRRIQPTLRSVGGIDIQNTSLLDEIQVRGGSASSVAIYKLDYIISGHLNFLCELKRLNSDGEYLRPLVFHWSGSSYQMTGNTLRFNFTETPSYRLYNPMTGWEIEKIEKHFGDVDGDGLQDLITSVYYRQSVRPGEYNRMCFWQVYLRDPNNSGGYSYLTERHWGNSDETGLNILLLDNDKQGKDKVYITTVKKEGGNRCLNMKVFAYQNNDMVKEEEYNPEVQSDIAESFEDFYLLGLDYKGKGEHYDFLIGTQNHKLHYLSESRVYETGIPSGENTAVYITDINGNGKPEIMCIRDSLTRFYEYHAGSAGFQMIHREEDRFYYKDQIFVGDFNGDGCTDFLHMKEDIINKDKKIKNKVLISIPEIRNGEYTGAITFNHTATIEDMVPVTGNKTKRIMQDGSLVWVPGDTITYPPVKLLLDVNQDGILDIISGCYFEEGSDPLKRIAFQADIYLGTGSGFTQVYDYKYLSVDPSVFSMVRPGKFSNHFDTGIITNYHPKDEYISYVDICPGQQYNKVLKITDSFGEDIQLIYQPVSTGKYILPNLYVNPDKNTVTDVRSNFLSGLLVVSQAKGSKTDREYTFREPHFNWKGSGFQGFGFRRVKDNKSAVVTEMEYHFDDTYCKLYPYREFATGIPADPISQTVYSYSFAESKYRKDKTFFLRLDTVEAEDYVNGVKSKTTYTAYDEDYNPKSIQTHYGDNGDISKTETFSYVKANTSLYYDSPASHTVLYQARNKSNIQRTEAFEYDSHGRLKKHTKDAEDENMSITFYDEYDSFGNAGKVSRTADGITLSKSYAYTADGRFIAREKDDQLGETIEYSYDSYGKLISKTTRLGTTTYQYDPFGRLKQTTYPDGIKTVSVLQWAGSTGPSGSKYYTYSQTSGEAPLKIWYDGRGRELRRESYGLDKQAVWVDTEYEQGVERVRAVSEPYFPHQARTWAQQYTYHGCGKVEKIITPMGITNHIFGSMPDGTFVNLTTHPMGNKETITNAAGWVIREETNGKKVDFTHYANGQVESATPEGGTAVTLRYDLQGNRTEIIDPDAGTVRTKYNAWGQLTEEKQAVHNSRDTVITHYTYHPSGFLTSKTRNNETTSYEYDHLYRLLRITLRDTGTNRRISQSFTYDEWDRITQVKDSIEAGKVFISGTEYDKLGRIKREIYPGDYFIENKYDTYSNLKSIYDSHSRKIWEAMEVNAKGQMIKTRRGDKETQYAYDDRGFPVTIHTAGIFGMDYSFNEKGNMEWRKDLVSGYEEHFGYDELNRLTNWSIVKNGIQQSSHNQVYKAGKTHIESKTGYGSGFTYGENNGKPHAFTSFTPEAGRVFSDVQAIDYTDFKKMKSITQGSSALNVFYGVDEQRVKSVMNEASGTTTRYYLSNYEQEEKDGKVRKLHYISGGDGLAAIYVQSWDSKDTLYYAYTDYQGSLYAVTNETGTVQERYAYDPWGVRRNPSDWTANDTRAAFIFQRGYTFHEHLTEFHLINMNGRMYDPGAGMFFSPDPYIQAPGDWLNYNRYSYALNNPLLYTDPSGEFLWFIPIITAAVWGTANTVAHAIRGDINNFWDGLRYFAQGAVTGFALGAAWQFSPLIPYIGQGLQTGMTWYAYGQAGMGVLGTITGVANDGWKGVGNGAKAFLGNFYLDENNWFGGAWQGFSRHTWEMPQTLIGHGYTQIRNISGDVDRVDYFGGATLATKENAGYNDGVTLGNYININIDHQIEGSFDDYVLGNPLYMHEYGHYIDNHYWGPIYLFGIGIPSIYSAGKHDGTHKEFWTEKRANKRTSKYFKKYFDLNWNYTNYPLK